MKATAIQLIICSILLIACNSDKVQRPEPLSKPKQNITKEQNPVIREAREARKQKEKDGPSTKQINQWRSQALSILNHRLKTMPSTDPIVEADLWEYQFVYDGEMSKVGDYDGVWLDFKKDHTYEYGKYKVVNGTGKYNFHEDRQEILMVDNNNSMKPQEWSIKQEGDVMIMVGTANYQDNHIQQKMQRSNPAMRN